LGSEFLNPYKDDVEKMVLHHGPVVNWVIGNTRAEITIRKLDLDNYLRKELIARKLEEINILISNFNSETNPTLRELIKIKLKTFQILIRNIPE